MSLTRPDITQVTNLASALPSDLTSDIGGLNLLFARIDTPTSPNAGGQQVADEFDDATGIGSLGSGTVASGYLSNVTGSGADQIPTMTSATAPSGTVTSSGEGNPGVYPAWKAFDNSDSTGWGGTGTSGWIAYDFGTSKVINKYTVTAPWSNYAPASYAPMAWTFEGWTGSAWVVLHTPANQTSWGDKELRTFTFSNLTGYTKYRLNITNTNGSNPIYLGELRMFIASTPNITTVSNAYTAAAVPSTITLVGEYQDISTTAVLNTDIVFSVSRDGGTTWSAVTMTSLGASLVSGALVVKGSVSVTGQPSGTSIKWKVATLNTKEQRLHGLWMSWK